jgi:hypothetical protein
MLTVQGNFINGGTGAVVEVGAESARIEVNNAATACGMIGNWRRA